MIRKLIAIIILMPHLCVSMSQSMSQSKRRRIENTREGAETYIVDPLVLDKTKHLIKLECMLNDIDANAKPVFDTSGERFAVINKNKQVKVCKNQVGDWCEEEVPPILHNGLPQSITFNKDGTRILISYFYGCITHIWFLNDGIDKNGFEEPCWKLEATLQVPLENSVNELRYPAVDENYKRLRVEFRPQFNEQETRVVAIGSNPGQAAVWMLNDGAWHLESELLPKLSHFSSLDGTARFDKEGTRLCITGTPAGVWGLDGSRWCCEKIFTPIGSACFSLVSMQEDGKKIKIVEGGKPAEIWELCNKEWVELKKENKSGIDRLNRLKMRPYKKLATACEAILEGFEDMDVAIKTTNPREGMEKKMGLVETSNPCQADRVELFLGLLGVTNPKGIEEGDLMPNFQGTKMIMQRYQKPALLWILDGAGWRCMAELDFNIVDAQFNRSGTKVR